MSEQMISNVQPDPGAAAGLNQFMPGSATVSASAAGAEVLEERAVRYVEGEDSQADTEANAGETSEAERAARRSMDVYLKFEIDEENELTIFVLDRENQKVLRTIPPEEIAKMTAGQLVELFI